MAPELSGDALHRSDREIFRVVFRLAQGEKLPMAEAALAAMTRNLDPERDRDRKGMVVRLMPANTVGYATPEQHAFVDTFNVVLSALVLSLVCANLASLLLARGTSGGGKSPFGFRWAPAGPDWSGSSSPRVCCCRSAAGWLESCWLIG